MEDATIELKSKIPHILFNAIFKIDDGKMFYFTYENGKQGGLRGKRIYGDSTFRKKAWWQESLAKSCLPVQLFVEEIAGLFANCLGKS